MSKIFSELEVGDKFVLEQEVSINVASLMIYTKISKSPLLVKMPRPHQGEDNLLTYFSECQINSIITESPFIMNYFKPDTLVRKVLV